MEKCNMSKSSDVFSYRSVCKLIGEALNRVLEHNVVYAAVHNVLRDFDNEALNDKFTDVSLFHGEKIYTVSNFRKNIVEMKIAEPCSIGLWKGKFNFSVGKTTTWLLSYRCTQETKFRVLQWKIVHNIYITKFSISIPFKVESEGWQEMFALFWYCSRKWKLDLLTVRLYLNFGNS